MQTLRPQRCSLLKVHVLARGVGVGDVMAQQPF
jgi:hypothetical protein